MDRRRDAMDVSLSMARLVADVSVSLVRMVVVWLQQVGEHAGDVACLCEVGRVVAEFVSISV